MNKIFLKARIKSTQIHIGKFGFETVILLTGSPQSIKERFVTREPQPFSDIKMSGVLIWL